MFFCSFLTLPNVYNAPKGNCQDLERVQPHFSEHSIAQSAISGCIKTAQFHSNSALDANVTNAQKIFKNLWKLERNEGSRSDKKPPTILLHYNFIYHNWIICYSITCGISFTTQCVKDDPLHTFAIFITVSKWGYIFYKGIDCYVAENSPHTHFTLRHKSCCDLYLLKTGPNKELDITVHFTLHPPFVSLCLEQSLDLRVSEWRF